MNNTKHLLLTVILLIILLSLIVAGFVWFKKSPKKASITKESDNLIQKESNSFSDLTLQLSSFDHQEDSDLLAQIDEDNQTIKTLENTEIRQIRRLASQQEINRHYNFYNTKMASIGKITPKIPSQIHPIEPASLINNRLYSLFVDNKLLYLGLIGLDNAKRIPLNLPQNPDPDKLSLTSPIMASSDGQRLALMITKNSLPPYYAVLVTADAELNQAETIYWEEQDNKPSLVNVYHDTDPKISLPLMYLHGWSKDNDSLYAGWELGGYGPSPSVGFVRIFLDGRTETNHLQSLADKALIFLSPSEKLAIIAKTGWQINSPQILNLESGELKDIPLAKIVKEEMAEINQDKKPEIVNNASFLGNPFYDKTEQYLYFAINYKNISPENNYSLKVWYQININKETLVPIKLNSYPNL